MLGLDLVLWAENPMFGIGGILGIIAYFIAYSIVSFPVSVSFPFL
jgi:hypothetical protein